MMKYNILYIHNKVDISGGERSLINLWKNINKEKFNLFLILPGKGALAEKAVECGVEVLYSEAPKLTFKNVFRILNTLITWTKYIFYRRIHIIHSYSPRNNILSGIVGRIFSRSVIWHERNLIYDDKFDVSRRFLFLPARVVCNSYAIAERFSIGESVPEKVVVVYNGVDLKKFNPFIDSTIRRKEYFTNDKRIVGVITNLSKRKRVEFFIDAAARIKEAYSNVVFIVVGGSFPNNDHRLRELKETTCKLGIENDIVFTGFQENTNEFISALDISVNVTEKEACSRAIIESMACGKAIVAMNDGGSPELIKNGVDGVLTPPMSISGFVDAIVDLLNDDEKRKALGAKARQTAENKFDIKKNVFKTQELYLSIVSRK